MAGDAVQIRRATKADADDVLALLDRYFREWNIEFPDSPDYVRTLLRPSPLGFFLAHRANVAVGCVLLRSLPEMPYAVECKRLYVPPEERGQGIAGVLMDAVEFHARTTGYSTVYLDSKDVFETAIALYRRRGYEPCERFNSNAEATVFMRKHLVSV